MSDRKHVPERYWIWMRHDPEGRITDCGVQFGTPMAPEIDSGLTYVEVAPVTPQGAVRGSMSDDNIVGYLMLYDDAGNAIDGVSMEEAHQRLVAFLTPDGSSVNGWPERQAADLLAAVFTGLFHSPTTSEDDEARRAGA